MLPCSPALAQRLGPMGPFTLCLPLRTHQALQSQETEGFSVACVNWEGPPSHPPSHLSLSLQLCKVGGSHTCR